MVVSHWPFLVWGLGLRLVQRGQQDRRQLQLVASEPQRHLLGEARFNPRGERKGRVPQVGPAQPGAARLVHGRKAVAPAVHLPHQESALVRYPTSGAPAARDADPDFRATERRALDLLELEGKISVVDHLAVLARLHRGSYSRSGFLMRYAMRDCSD